MGKTYLSLWQKGLEYASAVWQKVLETSHPSVTEATNTVGPDIYEPPNVNICGSYDCSSPIMEDCSSGFCLGYRLSWDGGGKPYSYTVMTISKKW